MLSVQPIRLKISLITLERSKKLPFISMEARTLLFGPIARDSSRRCIGNLAIDLPRVSRDQAKIGKLVKLQDLQKGDLMYFSTRADGVITHVGIAIDSDTWISNLNSKKSVEILSTMGPWTRNYFKWGYV